VKPPPGVTALAIAPASHAFSLALQDAQALPLDDTEGVYTCTVDLPASLASVRAVASTTDAPHCELTLHNIDATTATASASSTSTSASSAASAASAAWPTHVRVGATHRRSGASASLTLPLVAGFRLASAPAALSAAGVVELGGESADAANSTTVMLTGNRTGVAAAWQFPHALTVVALPSAEPVTSFLLEVRHTIPDTL
jgi:hypothetical protein